MLADLLLNSGTFLLFIAPPAWGKTRMLIDLHRSKNFKILYISPLRALAENFYASLRELPNVEMVVRKSEYQKCCDRLMKQENGILVCTAEMVGKLTVNKKLLVVFDEFHLFYYWGQSFREHLFELVMAVSNCKIPILGLTATMNEELMGNWKRDFGSGCDYLYILDVGNQRLKYLPKKKILLFFKDQFCRRFIWELKKKRGVTLLFCAYRQEVDRWVAFLNEMGIVALGCKGGEVKQFVADLLDVTKLQCIVATTALSHGVNLPTVKNVFIDYKLNNKDFLIQMIGRGGRNGEDYNIYINDVIGFSKGQIISQFIINLGFDVLLRAGLYFTTCKPK